MFYVNRANPQEIDCVEHVKQIVFTWGPRACFAAVAGYYSLGVAYEIGLMAALDRVAIRVLKHTVGYAGIGAIMPTFQWYAAKGVQVASAIAGGLVYDVAERVVLYFLGNKNTPEDARPGVPQQSQNDTHLFRFHSSAHHIQNLV